MGEVLYKILIGPLQLLFEFIFIFSYRAFDNYGISIVVLSLVMNFLVLPLYNRVDAIQEEERVTAERLRPGVEHIRKTFRGDERFMMLQTYYRQNHYKQTDALKGSFSLLLEVPFFLAAYRFLSNLTILQGVHFGPIADLGSPDAMLQLGGMSINVLPILMTVINLLSAAIYLKGFPLRSKLQTVGMALIFLVLLYDSPAGLVFYWTLNNLFSLVKNIFHKLKNPKLVLVILISLSGVLFGLYMPDRIADLTEKKKLLIMAGALVLQLPLVLYILLRFFGKSRPKREAKTNGRLYFAAVLFLTVLTGALIPSALIHDSTAEFVDVADPHSPLRYVLSACCYAVGTFLVWFGIFYRLSDKPMRRIFTYGMAALAVIAAADYLFFGTGYGNISSLLQFDTLPEAGRKEILLNLLVIAAIAAVMLLLWRKKEQLALVLVTAMCLAVTGMSVINCVGIARDYTTLKAGTKTAQEDHGARIPLSKTGKNVIVMMMDRAIGDLVPYLVEEKPELRELLDGFTYYPNCISFAQATNGASPALYGGYEYTPERINARAELPLVAKQNEALRLMPVLFDEAGYQVTVFDPPYAGYSEIPDLSIYDDHPDIRAWNTMNGGMPVTFNNGENTEKVRSRNFFAYSIFKMAPLAVQPVLYNKGTYNMPETELQIISSASEATGLSHTFMQSYNVLQHLGDITEFDTEEENTFLMMTNNTSHEPTLLSEPSYEPSAAVDNRSYDADHAQRSDGNGNAIELWDISAMTHYHANMAALLGIGRYCDFLRENGVYDNTRIIVVSDHGRPLGLHPDRIYTGEVNGMKTTLDTMGYECLLMVKDFGSTGFGPDEQFMTNADTPTMAMTGLLENPVNPATGSPVFGDYKSEGEQHVVDTEYRIVFNNGNTFTAGNWYAVRSDIRDVENWSFLGTY